MTQIERFCKWITGTDGGDVVGSENTPHPLKCQPLQADSFLGWVIPNRERTTGAGLVLPDAYQERAHACYILRVSEVLSRNEDGSPKHAFLERAAHCLRRGILPNPVMFLPLQGEEWRDGGHDWVVLHASRATREYRLRPEDVSEDFPGLRAALAADNPEAGARVVTVAAASNQNGAGDGH